MSNQSFKIENKKQWKQQTNVLAALHLTLSSALAAIPALALAVLAVAVAAAVAKSSNGGAQPAPPLLKQSN